MSCNPQYHPILERWDAIRSARGGEPAIFNPTGTVWRTFAAIEQEARYWTDFLGNHPAGQTLALQIGNAVEWPAILLAAWRTGQIVVPFDHDLQGERRRRIDALCGVSLRAERSGEGNIQWVPGDVLPVGWNEPRPDFLKLTSGTTGDPRVIRFREAQLLADCDAVCETMGLREDDRNYGVIALSHSYGFSNLITPLLCRGIPLVLAADMIPRAVVDGLAASGATVFPGVPAIFRTLAEFSPGPGHLRLCLSAGAPLSREVASRFAEAWQLKIHSFYGASECGGICYDAGNDPNPPAGFIGQPMKGVTLRPHEAEGPSLVRVEGAAVGEGYYPEEDSMLCRGTFEPADLLEATAEGYIIRGRVSDVINVAGRKVSPGEIERVLRSAPGVRDVVVLGMPGTARGEEIAACIVGETTEEALRRHCVQQLPSWQIPKQWFFLEEIPLTARGKMDRSELRIRIQ